MGTRLYYLCMCLLDTIIIIKMDCYIEMQGNDSIYGFNVLCLWCDFVHVFQQASYVGMTGQKSGKNPRISRVKMELIPAT